MDVTLDLGPQGIVFSYTDTSVEETGVTIFAFFLHGLTITFYSSLVCHICWGGRFN
jgi:hypothetical protein